MRIAFLCGSIEPGRDGVGDYTRRLAQACGGRGIQVAIVALNEPEANTPGGGAETGNDDVQVECLRTASALSWSQRFKSVQKFLDSYRPDWVSLQFVPYSFHPKGLPMTIPRRLGKLRGQFHWHVMFHELWIGAAKGSSLKQRLIGCGQRGIIRSLLHTLRPSLVSTQASPYIAMLRQIGWYAERFPLFGNIPITVGGAEDGWRLVQELLGGESGRDRHEWLIGGIFGTIHPQWDERLLFDFLARQAQRNNQRALVVVIGRHGCDTTRIRRLSAESPYVRVIVLGELPQINVSAILQCLDFGIATSPWALVEKSGSVASMLEHGLPVVVTRNDWHIDEYTCLPYHSDPLLVPLDSLVTSGPDLWPKKRSTPRARLPETVDHFLGGLQDTASAR